MTKGSSNMSAARRNAEALLGKSQKRESTLQLDQERAHSLSEKTAKLRALRLAKEAADLEAASLKQVGTAKRRSGK